MHPVIVVTQLGLLPPAERWSRLVLPLEEELAAGGLGRILDFEMLQRKTLDMGYCPAEEVAVELAHHGYGRELVDRVLSAAGLPVRSLLVPSRWRGYRCEEYFSGGWAERGHFDELSQMWVIVPLSEAYENSGARFLVIGHSGCNGIDFGNRDGHPGLWAYPVDGGFKLMADSIAALVDGWCAGKLSV